MIDYNINMVTLGSQKVRERIFGLEEYFHFEDSPEDVLEEFPPLAEKAINLLDKIKEITGKEYEFIQVQQLSLGGYCKPVPKGYDPSGTATFLLGRYNKQYFESFLAQKKE